MNEQNMPFAPFHLGPALVLGPLLRKYVHVPTFIVANMVVDVEPFLGLLLGLSWRRSNSRILVDAVITTFLLLSP